ncbi:MAG: RNA polymerase factor sigma-32 [Deltaproteobacteria bacterium]|nr:RNA polymerase factor sigma-32 [Deltaproteobacteria bacterium]
MAKKKHAKPKVVTPEVLETREEDIEGSDPDASASKPEAHSDSTGLVPILESRAAYTPKQRDLLRKYIEDISRFPLLSPEDEFELAVKLTQTGDVDAARRLVTANLRLVVKIAMEYRNAYQNVMDLIQEGNVGLMKAVSKYDPTKGAKLSYYASWWIRSYILKYILDNFRLVRVGTTQAQKKLFFHLIREKERLEAQGLPAGPKLLADRLHVREQDVREMEQRLGGQGSELRLNAPLGEIEGGATHMDSLPDRAESPEEMLAEHELLNILKKNLDEFATTLQEKELTVFSERMVSEHPKTLQEIADRFGLTRERARQIETRVLEKLREFYRGLIG